MGSPSHEKGFLEADPALRKASRRRAKVRDAGGMAEDLGPALPAVHELQQRALVGIDALDGGDCPDIERWSLRARTALVLGSSLALWSLIGTTIYTLT